jgi:hypothetical protein
MEGATMNADDLPEREFWWVILRTPDGYITSTTISARSATEVAKIVAEKNCEILEIQPDVDPQAPCEGAEDWADLDYNNLF